MLLARGNTPLNYRRLGRADLGLVEALELDPEQIERFLGPVADIQDAVRHGPAHSMVAIEAAGALVGFYVVHPDPRDAACWWLGWFALDRRQQGRGFGGQAMLAVMDRLRHIPGCRRIRLLVAPDNERARLLYDRAGFCPVSRLRSTGELVLELTLRSGVTADLRSAFMLAIVAAGARRVFRHRRLRSTVGPHAAWVIGVERGPPCAGFAAFAGSRPALRVSARAFAARARSSGRPPAGRGRPGVPMRWEEPGRESRMAVVSGRRR